MSRFLPWWPLAVAALAGLLGWLWLAGHDRRVREEMEAEIAQQVADSVTAAVTPFRDRALRDSLAAAAARAQLEETRASAALAIAAALRNQREAEQEVRTAGASVDQTVDTVRVLDATLGDSLGVQIGRERRAHVSVAEALRQQLAAESGLRMQTETALAASERDCAACRALVASLEEALVASQAAGERWQDLANPSFIERFRQNFGVFTIGAAIGTVGGFVLATTLQR